MKSVQYFSPEYLDRCSEMTADQIVRFLDDFRQLHAGVASRSKLISMKVPSDLLEAFKQQARLAGVPYQTQIKQLMRAWVLESRTEGDG